MKVIGLLLAALFVLTAFPAFGEKHCPLCEKNRAYHQQHPENNYYWYDDYLKDQADKEKGLQPRPSDDQAETSSSLF